MKKSLLLLSIILAVTGSSIAAATGVYEQKMEKVTVTAKGLDQGDALYNALSAAVSRVNGMALNPAAAYIRQWDVKGGYKPQDGGISVDGRLTQTRMTKDVISERFEGYIKTYNIVKERQVDGQTEITVDVEVFKYVHPLSDTTDKRVRITINEFMDESGKASFISDDLVSELSRRFTSTGKFNVLDRKYLRDFAAERNIMLSDDAALADKARLAMVSGTDIMISGTVRDFRLKDILRPEHKTTRTLGLYEARVRIDYSVILPSTLQTRISDTVEFTLSADEVRKLYQAKTPADLDIDVAAAEAAIAGIAAQVMVDKITEYAYPVLVASVQGQTVYLNEGGTRIKAGDEFDVFKKGEEIFDPQTSLSLGSIETKVASLKVDYVKERMAVASIIAGDVNDIKVASVCRWAAHEGQVDKTPYKPAQQPAAYKPTPEQQHRPEMTTPPAFVPAKLAIVPVSFPARGYYYLGTFISGTETAENFEQYMATSLRRMGKFDLLDRRYDAEYRKELQLMLDSSPVNEIIGKLDNVSSADYLLVGKLAEFSVVKDSFFIEAAGLRGVEYGANLLYNYRIIEFATRKVVFTGSVNLYYDDDQIKTLVPELNYSDRIPQGESRIRFVLASVAARNVAGQITDEIYPMLLIAVDGYNVVVSSGASALENGQELTVFRRGEPLVDPYTGNVVGALETEVGRIIVTRAEAAVAYARIISGNPDEFTKGGICKPNWQEMATRRQEGKRSGLRTTPGGGVYLPVDEK